MKVSLVTWISSHATVAVAHMLCIFCIEKLESGIQVYNDPSLTSTISSGNKKIEHPSFRATLIIYVAFDFLSSSAIQEELS